VRVNAQEPLDSLILTKGAMLTKHKGKERFKKGSWEYNLLAKWIQGGAKLDVEQTGDFDRLEVLPKELVFKKAGDAVQLKVLAHWKDGTIEDVTQITRFRSNDDSVAAISDTGRVESKAPGDTHVVAFYDNGVLPVPAMLAMSEFTGPKFPKVATRTKVDELVVAKLRNRPVGGLHRCRISSPREPRSCGHAADTGRSARVPRRQVAGQTREKGGATAHDARLRRVVDDAAQ
jgi:hypothetical protein